MRIGSALLGFTGDLNFNEIQPDDTLLKRLMCPNYQNLGERL